MPCDAVAVMNMELEGDLTEAQFDALLREVLSDAEITHKALRPNLYYVRTAPHCQLAFREPNKVKVITRTGTFQGGKKIMEDLARLIKKKKGLQREPQVEAHRHPRQGLPPALAYAQPQVQAR